MYRRTGRGVRPEEAEAMRLAADHGFGPDRLVPLRSLARSRSVDLTTVLRAALSGDLRQIVALPPTREVS